ncbi:ABC transporter ATP-binding protein [Clostridium aestuarii]|uniref:Quaternary amine transport ATP-binding protein n=1 Tax=Clostridium aestuarii TaxID=338193 RepID=A0ABT4D336_9CLOT|nr:ABC transporter ATP-binding protein [Clostridium aestuarii]
MDSIVFKNVTMYYKNNKEKPAVNKVDLELEKGKVIIFVGPSGCGKSTLLKMINRLYEPNSGEIFIDDKNIKEISPVQLRRSMGYVVQQTGLFPHMTVLENISVVPQMLNWEKNKILDRAKELLELVNLEPDTYLNRFPKEISGGQQQRVGIARAMAANPEILLMDEPFSAIDVITRVKLQNEIINLQRKSNKTIFIVTHDVDEALKLADIIVILKEGEIIQYGAPLEIINHPKNEFVEGFIGCKDVLKKLSVITIERIMEKSKETTDVLDKKQTLREFDTLKMALSVFLQSGNEVLTVINDDEKKVGNITWNALQKVWKGETYKI